MKKFNLTGISILLSAILVGCGGSSSDVNDTSIIEEDTNLIVFDGEFTPEDNIEDHLDNPNILDQETQDEADRIAQEEVDRLATEQAQLNIQLEAAQADADILEAKKVQDEADAQAEVDRLNAQKIQDEEDAQTEIDRLEAQRVQDEADAQAEADRLEEEQQAVEYQIPPISNTDRDSFLQEINSARGTARSCGSSGDFPAVPSLTWSTKLYEASYEHNYDMLHSKTFSHYGSGTKYDITGVSIDKASNPYDRVLYSGYLDNILDYGVGENIAEGQQDIHEVIAEWLGSDAHCANIMNSDFTEMGISKVEASYGYFWTNKFAYR